MRNALLLLDKRGGFCRGVSERGGAECDRGGCGPPVHSQVATVPEPSARTRLLSRPLNYRTLNYRSEYTSGCVLQMANTVPTIMSLTSTQGPNQKTWVAA